MSGTSGMSGHSWSGQLEWTGNTGAGTSDYAVYERDYRISFDGKPIIHGTADTAFRGRSDLHNPEELFIASVAACHMLFWLSLCARNGIRALSYEDSPTGELAMDAKGGGRFREIVLRPVASIAEGDDVELALRLHELAHARCFIASSCSIPIRHEAQVIEVHDPRAGHRSGNSGTHVISADSAAPMFDLTIDLEDTPGALATMGEALGRASVSIEGGGAWVAGGRGVAHFLFRDGAAARRALEDAGIRVLAERAVVAQRLDQGTPGQLGRLTRRMADAGVNIEALYSDHDNRLILVVRDEERARVVSEEWSRGVPVVSAASRP